MSDEHRRPLTDTTLGRTRLAAQAVLLRAARDGERVVCSARIVLAVVTIVAWVLYTWTAGMGPADRAVIGMSSGSLLFSIAVLAWLRPAKPARMTTWLRTLSILVDAALIVGGLTIFIFSPPPGYQGVVREAGLSLAYFGVLASGIRLSQAGVVLASVVFGAGVLFLLTVDRVQNPHVEIVWPSVLTTFGLMLTAAVFAWRIASRTRRHVLEGANNAALEINGLNAALKARVRERSNELSLALKNVARQRSPLAPGALLGERFAIEGQIGAGGMGFVYAGTDRVTGRRVAIKVIQARSASQLDGLHRFLREARAAAAITHPAVVQMLNVDVSDDGLLFQVQELVEGVTLEQRLQSGGALAPAIAARVGELLASALSAAHEQGIVHRDVKPSNVMLTRDAPGLKLLDFGVVKLADASGDDDDNTGTGQFVGTPAYMAPEQVAAEDAISDRTDVYAAGVLLFRALTLAFPAAGLDALDEIGCAPLKKTILRCLEPRSEGRPSARALAAELNAIADALEAPALETVDHGEGQPAALGELSQLLGELVRAPEVAPPSELLKGGRVGRYLIVGPIAPGAQGTAPGTVWRARDERLGRLVAVRMLPPDAAADVKDRFLAGGRAAAGVWHRSLPAILEVDVHDGAPFVAMELVEGEPLPASMLRGLSRERVSEIVRALAHALECAHAAGIAHGAVHAGNVRIDAAGGAKLLDLGVHRGEASPAAVLKDVLAFGALLQAMMSSDGRSPLAVLSRRCLAQDPALGSGRDLVAALQ